MQIAQLCPFLAAGLIAGLMFFALRRRLAPGSAAVDVVVAATVVTGLAFGVFRHA
ncbi:hypothetical protein QTH87_14565 [Variovorax sp. J22P168]|uniref:hypothetical protein n=1 Tax=Variovorax jilinensis TaxID=3053513 RepID=UPI002575CF95|nr:hypothetical protein [Variovorax sp. J22P168]MDM0013661.1 hypothetical protein [Variovorax sp. J22P168]